MRVCVHVCRHREYMDFMHRDTYTNTHLHAYIHSHIYIYIYSCTLGAVDSSLSLSDLSDTSRFPPARLCVSMQCAGNRRSELHAIAPTQGLQWTCGGMNIYIYVCVCVLCVYIYICMCVNKSVQFL